MSDLTNFLLARIAEDEELGRSAAAEYDVGDEWPSHAVTLTPVPMSSARNDSARLKPNALDGP